MYWNDEIAADYKCPSGVGGISQLHGPANHYCWVSFSNVDFRLWPGGCDSVASHYAYWHRCLIIFQGTARRKKKVVHRTATADDKKLQSSLKKLAVNNIAGIEEVCMLWKPKL